MIDNNNYLEEIKPINVKTLAILNEIKTWPCDNQANCDKCVDQLKAVASLKKTVDNTRKEYVKPLKDKAKEIDASFKKPLDFLSEADTILRAKINKYNDEKFIEMQKKQAEEKRIAEEKALEEALKLQKEIEQADHYDEVTKQALVQINKDEQDQIIEETAKQEKISLSTANSSVRRVWAFDVVDITKVPAQFLLIDEKAVRSAITGGQTEIDGLKIYQKTSVAVK